MPYVEQLSFTEAIVPRAARYKAVASIGGDSVFRQEFHLPDAVPGALERVGALGGNTYLSLGDFRQRRRAGEFLFGFSAFGFDIDCHDSQDPASDAYAAYQHLQGHLFGGPAFPVPTMVEHTGRGLLVLMAFERAPRHVLPLWLRMGEGWAGAIREALPPFATLDTTYRDSARVVRVPGTYNTAAGRRAEVLGEIGPVYKLETLRDRYFPELNPRNFGQESPVPAPKAKIYFKDADVRLHVDRMFDLLKLCALRKNNLDGMREKVLFLYRYWTCFYIGPEVALEAALELNKGFTHPLPENEATRATRSAEEAFDRWREDKRTGYNYTNAKLIEFLRITPEEQRKLKTIISKKEKARRRAEKKQWGHAIRDGKRSAARARRELEIMRDLNDGMTHREVIAKYRCNFTMIQNILNAPPLELQIELFGNN